MQRSIYILALLAIVTACGQGSSYPTVKNIKIGKPYVIAGKTYYPAYDASYDKVGTASWYGPGFHGKYTANGEVFNQNDLTAAHPTLPMPSIVRVTNLKNGRTLLVRINDRGPFKANRIIDLSKKSAKMLGISGLGKVRVTFLKRETEEFISNMQGAKHVDMEEYNRRAEDRENIALAASAKPSAEIVNSTISSNHRSRPVSDAAPILSVDSGNLDRKPIRVNEIKPVELYTKGNPVPAKAKVIPRKNAALDDEVEPGAIWLTNAPKAKSKAIETAELNPSAGGSVGYFIQAGSFSAEVNAQRLKGKLEQIHEASVERVNVADKTWWRVRVGPFAQKSSANIKLADVRASGVPDAKIIRR